MLDLIRRRYFYPSRPLDYQQPLDPDPIVFAERSSVTVSSGVKWITVAKDLVATLVGLITIIQFVWPGLRWIWELSLAYVMGSLS